LCQVGFYGLKVMSKQNRISQWHFFISGATQNRQQSTGLQKAWLDAKINDKPGYVEKLTKTCFFPVLPWNYDWYTLARFIQINSQYISNEPKWPESPLINIYGYSWGAGYGAIQLATYLQSVAQYDIQNMVLTDPVYCSSSRFMRWRAVFTSRFHITRKFAPKITIPSNVLSVHWSRQFNNWPRAHALYSLPHAKTVIHPPNLESSLIHSQMDESFWFQSKVQELCNV